MTTETTIENYQFFIDSAEPILISGWAYLSDNDAHNPVVEVRSGETVLWETAANIYREDLAKAGIGNGHYAFSITPMSMPVKEAVSSIDLYIDGHKIQEAIPFEMQPVNIDDYRVHLDNAELHQIKGWANKNEQTNYRPQIEVRCDNVVIASGFADEFRPDLLDAGIGDGAYAFFLTPRLEKFPSTDCECVLFVDGIQSNIPPFVLHAERDAIDEAVYKDEFSAQILDFTSHVENKMTALKDEIIAINTEQGQDNLAINGQLQVAMNNIAELSVRVKVIEQVLTKHFSTTKA